MSIATSDAVIDAKLFRLDQIPTFLNNINLYRDSRLTVSFSNIITLLLEKGESMTEYPGDATYRISGVNYAAEEHFSDAFVYYALSSLFEERNVRVHVSKHSNRWFFPVNSKSIEEFMFKLEGYYSEESKPTQQTEGKIVHTAQIWRITQLQRYAEWINTYRDKNLEVMLESDSKLTFILEKPDINNYGDKPYEVIGTSPGNNVYERLTELFKKLPVRMQISNQPQEEYKKRKPIQLEKCILEFAKYHDDARRN